MLIGVHIPCYINELYPKVAKATIDVLKKLNLDFEIPKNQTCCGQPLINSGYKTDLPLRMAKKFEKYDYIVSPSSSCVSTIKKSKTSISNKTYELAEFLYDVLGLRGLLKNYSKKIALHNSCHSLRELLEGVPSELNIPYFNKVEELLGCELLKASRDECCGFGGVFSIKEGFISYVIGRNKLDDLLSKNPEIITGVDMGCLMHLEGIARKDGDNVEFKHISQLILESLNETL